MKKKKNKLLDKKLNYEQTYDSDVCRLTIDYAKPVGLETVDQAFAKADHVHGTGDGVRQGKYETDGTAELRSQRSGNHVICPTCEKKAPGNVRAFDRSSMLAAVSPTRRFTHMQTITEDIN